MLWNASDINGYAISASDGKIGTVSDFLFDETSWLVRWLVVETGSWLFGRKVLVPSSALASLGKAEKECVVDLTMLQIKESPDVDTDRPVSRQMETSVYGHYGYRPYWNSGYGFLGGIGYMGGYGYMGGMGGAVPISPESKQREEEVAEYHRNHDDVHLRSVAAVSRCQIHATDGEIGHVKNLLIEDLDWSVRYFAVDTSNWWPGKTILVLPRLVLEISWSENLVELAVDRRMIKEAPAYDGSTIVDHAYSERILSYYGLNPVEA